MKIKIQSDIHLEFGPHMIGYGDVLVLAGDICVASDFQDNITKYTARYKSFFRQCSENYNRVFYVMGNHEHYCGDVTQTKGIIEEYLYPNITLLDNKAVRYNDMLFVGGTMWTNFYNGDHVEMLQAQYAMNDYECVKVGDNRMTPGDTLSMHDEAVEFFDCITRGEDNVFMITHHAPSFKSCVGSRVKNMKSAYASDLSQFILNRPQIKYWAHGHIHESLDYRIGQCRVMCNPRGYFNVSQNGGFYNNFDVTVQEVAQGARQGV